MTTLPVDNNGSSNEIRQVSGGGVTIDAVTTDLIKIIDAVSIPIVVVRRDFSVACFNRAAADELRFVSQDIGRSPRDIAILSGLQNLDRWCAEVISTDVPTRHDIRVADRSFIIRIAPYTNCQISGTVLTFINVTAFRASIDQAIYEREYAKSILNTVPDPLVVLAADLDILTANRAFFSMFGVSRAAIQGVRLNELCDGTLNLSRLVTQLKEMLANDLAFQPLEIDWDWPEVGRRTMSLRACQLALPGHPTQMALLSFHDITARKEAETTNSRLAAMVEFSDDAIVTEDTDGMITSWNGGAQRILGYAADEVIGKPIPLLIPADRQHQESNVRERIRRGERVESYDTVRQRKDGSLVEIFVTISPIKNTAGRVIGASNIARDITDRKRAEIAQRLLADEVDHRSRNLLALVQATVHFSQADTPHTIKAAIEGRIQALSNVHTLLAKSRWAGADLRSLVMDELSPYCPQGTPRADVHGPDLILKPHSAQLIAMVFHELATNAVKYGALSVPAGRVRVEWLHGANGKLVLRWTETNGPPVKPPTRQGFGSRVLDRAIAAQLKGKSRYEWRTEGLAYELAVKVS
jgi:PAS domain S-box-containing protein